MEIATAEVPVGLAGLLEAEIRAYDEKVRALSPPRSPEERGLVELYEALVSCRRRMLTALQEGEPDGWFEDPEAGTSPRPLQP